MPLLIFVPSIYQLLRLSIFEEEGGHLVGVLNLKLLIWCHWSRNIDKVLSFVFPLLADGDANIKVQIFVLRKDTADIIGKHVRMKEPVYSLDGNHLAYLLYQPFILSQLLGQWRRQSHTTSQASRLLTLRSSVETTRMRRRSASFWAWGLGKLVFDWTVFCIFHRYSLSSL